MVAGHSRWRLSSKASRIVGVRESVRFTDRLLTPATSQPIVTATGPRRALRNGSALQLDKIRPTPMAHGARPASSVQCMDIAAAKRAPRTVRVQKISITMLVTLPKGGHNQKRGANRSISSSAAMIWLCAWSSQGCNFATRCEIFAKSCRKSGITAATAS